MGLFRKHSCMLLNMLGSDPLRRLRGRECWNGRDEFREAAHMISNAALSVPLFGRLFLPLAVRLATGEDAVGDHQQCMRDRNHCPILVLSSFLSKTFVPHIYTKSLTLPEPNHRRAYSTGQPLKDMGDIRVYCRLHRSIVAACAYSHAISICRESLDRRERHAALNFAETLSSLLAGLNPGRKLLDVVALRRHVLPAVLDPAMPSGHIIEIKLRHGIYGLRPFGGVTVPEKRERA